MEFISVEVEGVQVKGAGGAAGSKGSSSATTDVVNKWMKVDVRRRNGGEYGDVSADSASVVHCGRFEAAAAEVNFLTDVENFGDFVAPEEGGERCLSGNVEDPGTASCCSSNERSESVDLEVKSGELDALTIQSRMPSQAEIEDFFSSTEKKSSLQFKEKYNFDFEKEEPLIGRYEWKPFTAVAASAPPKEKEIITAGR